MGCINSYWITHNGSEYSGALVFFFFSSAFVINDTWEKNSLDQYATAKGEFPLQRATHRDHDAPRGSRASREVEWKVNNLRTINLQPALADLTA
jgi:hypothetical protein